MYAVRVFLLFSRLVKWPQTYLAKYFFLSPLAFGFIVLLLLPTKRNETQREETKRETKRNATKQNSNWISNSNLNLNSSKAFVINSKIHTPCRAENRALTAEEWERGERGVSWGAVCCCLSLVLCWLPMLFCLNINDDENTRNYSAFACIRTWATCLRGLLLLLLLLLFLTLRLF